MIVQTDLRGKKIKDFFPNIETTVKTPFEYCEDDIKPVETFRRYCDRAEFDKRGECRKCFPDNSDIICKSLVETKKRT